MNPIAQWAFALAPFFITPGFLIWFKVSQRKWRLEMEAAAGHPIDWNAKALD